MSVGAKMSETRRPFGLSSQRYECRRRRELEEEIRAGDDTVGPPHEAGVRKERRSVAPPQQIPCGFFHSVVCPVFGGHGEWAPPWIPAPRDRQDVTKETYNKDYSFYLSSLDLHHGRELLDYQYAPF